MARRRAKIFSEREMEVMDAVWKLQKASIKEIRNEMGGNKAGAYTSIATMLKFLESKGAVRHEQKGRIFVYSPCISKKQEQLKALNYILTSYFDGNVQAMMRMLQYITDSDKEDRAAATSALTTRQL